MIKIFYLNDKKMYLHNPCNRKKEYLSLLS